MSLYDCPTIISSTVFEQLIGLLCLLMVIVSTTDGADADSSPQSRVLKVFVLVGQSNMQGHGYMNRTDDDNNYYNGTLEWMVRTHPEEYGQLSNGQDPITGHSEWVQREDVYIAYNRQNIGNVRAEMKQYGRLTAGYGGDPGRQWTEMGPELGIGWAIGDGMNVQKKNIGEAEAPFQQEVLLIKIAWGGRSLAVDFRPPSSAEQVEDTTAGLYYESMIANTFKTLSKLDTLFPQLQTYDYDIAGFAWHQGWNDGCDSNMTREYEFNLANLIRDVRKDFDVPNLPVVIGVSGMSGWDPKDPKRDAIINAQFAVADPAKYPEFAGTVTTVETRDFVRPQLPSSPGKQGYHWNNNCETYWLIGQTMGKAMVDLVQKQSSKVFKHISQPTDPKLHSLKLRNKYERGWFIAQSY